MKIKILGTRGEIDESLPQYSKHSGILIDQKILFDLGEKEFLDYKPKWIFLTHLHPDHAYFVRWGQEESPATKAQIYAPELPKSEKIKAHIEVLDKSIKIDSYSIDSIPTHHSKNVKSHAYLIRKGKESVLYTGDLVWMDKKYLEPLNQIDLVITDGSFARQGGMVRKDKETQALYGHNGIPNLIDLFKHHTKNILFVHFGAWFYKDPKTSIQFLQNLGNEKGVHVIAGKDDLEINTAKVGKRNAEGER